jgi:hypothetical protein
LDVVAQAPSDSELAAAKAIRVFFMISLPICSGNLDRLRRRDGGRTLESRSEPINVSAASTKGHPMRFRMRNKQRESKDLVVVSEQH